jgi:hypothetical protein
MCRGEAWRGRAGQAIELGEPGVADGTKAKFIRRGLPRAVRGWPGCQDEGPREELLAARSFPFLRALIPPDTTDHVLFEYS